MDELFDTVFRMAIEQCAQCVGDIVDWIHVAHFAGRHERGELSNKGRWYYPKDWYAKRGRMSPEMVSLRQLNV